MNNHKKKILIIGDNPFDKRKTGKKLGGKYTFGGVGRSVENLVTSELFLERFNFDLFDDNNRYSSIMGSLINSFSSLWKLSKKLNKKDYDLVLLYCNSVYFAFIHKFLICVVVKISNINLFVRYGGSSSFEFFSKSYMSLLFNLFFSMQAGLLVQGKTGKFFYKRLVKCRILFLCN